MVFEKFNAIGKEKRRKQETNKAKHTVLYEFEQHFPIAEKSTIFGLNYPKKKKTF